MTCKEISDRILARTDDTIAAPEAVLADLTIGNVPPELLSYINEGQELFALLALPLETTATFTLTAANTFATIRGDFPDFIAPLRLMIGSTRVRPSTLAELDAMDDSWQSTPGTPSRYLTMGFNFYAVTPQPITDTTASLTYARSPVQLVKDAFPEIDEQYHQNLVEYGIYREKLKEGAQGLQRGMNYFNSFLDAAKKCADYTRAKSKSSRFDTLPIPAALFDRAKLIQKKGK